MNQEKLSSLFQTFHTKEGMASCQSSTFPSSTSSLPFFVFSSFSCLSFSLGLDTLSHCLSPQTGWDGWFFDQASEAQGVEQPGQEDHSRMNFFCIYSCHHNIFGLFEWIVDMHRINSESRRFWREPFFFFFLLCSPSFSLFFRFVLSFSFSFPPRSHGFRDLKKVFFFWSLCSILLLNSF